MFKVETPWCPNCYRIACVAISDSNLQFLNDNAQKPEACLSTIHVLQCCPPCRILQPPPTCHLTRVLLQISAKSRLACIRVVSSTFIHLISSPPYRLYLPVPFLVRNIHVKLSTSGNSHDNGHPLDVIDV